MKILPLEKKLKEKLNYESLDKKSLKIVIYELKKIKSYIFQNTLVKIDYLKIYKETGEQPPFYPQVIQLNNLIEYLEFWEGRAKDGIIDN